MQAWIKNNYKHMVFFYILMVILSILTDAETALVATIVGAFCMEAGQPQNRSGNKIPKDTYNDLIADACGIALGLLTVWFL